MPLILMVLGRCWADLTVSSQRPGCVFFPGETVRLGVRVNSAKQAGSLGYTVTDYWGSKIAAGSVTVGTTQATALSLGVLPQGWYRLDFSLPDGSSQVDAVAVLPPMQDKGCHFRLFGACATLDSQDLADFLSYAGVRSIRRDWAWPNIEPAAGTWSSAFTGPIMNRARLAGMEFVPIVGYSPAYLGVKPVDATSGREAIATHTWPMADLTKWQAYLAWCKSYAASLQPTYWPPYRLLPLAAHRQKLSPVAAWEVWNEADQNFYYGPWHQYSNLLRMAYGVLDSPLTPVMYGGSCGHWTEMGMSYGWGLRDFFDFAAGHPGGSPEQDLPNWYYGAYSIGYKYGEPYTLAFTEGYFCDDTYHTPPPLFVLPMIAKLRHWGIEWRYKGIGWISSASPDFSTDQYAYVQPYGIVPTPNYVATATARYWLVDAAYVGHLTLDSGIHLYVFLRDDGPLAILWKPDGAASLDLRCSRGARVINFLGATVGHASSTSLSLEASPEPLMVLGAGWSYVADAAAARYDEFLDSNFGVQPDVQKVTGYVGLLGSDLAKQEERLTVEATDWVKPALYTLRNGPHAAYPRLYDGCLAVGRLLQGLVAGAKGDSNDGGRFNTYWRTLWLARWLAELTDAAGANAGEPPVRPYQIAQAQLVAMIAWAAAVNPSTGVDKVRARTVARRALEDVDFCSRSQGAMMRYLSWTEAIGALGWAAVEQPAITRVIAFAEFPDSQYAVKSQLLDPSHKQTVQLYLCNDTLKTVAATVKAALPGDWSPANLSFKATAAPGQVVLAGTAEVSLPSDQPWEKKQAWRPAGPLWMNCPKELPANQSADVWAEIGDQATVKMGYLFALGEITTQ